MNYSPFPFILFCFFFATMSSTPTSTAKRYVKRKASFFLIFNSPPKFCVVRSTIKTARWTKQESLLCRRRRRCMSQTETLSLAFVNHSLMRIRKTLNEWVENKKKRWKSLITCQSNKINLKTRTEYFLQKENWEIFHFILFRSWIFFLESFSYFFLTFSTFAFPQFSRNRRNVIWIYVIWIFLV